MSHHESNLFALLRERARGPSPHAALMYKTDGTWQPLGWGEYHARAEACAAGLVRAGVAPGDRVGVLAENGWEWLVADLGILGAGAVSVPLHATLPAEQIEILLRDADVRWLFVSDAQQLEKVGRIRQALPNLAGVTRFQGGGGAGALAWDEWLRGGDGGHAAELARRQERLGPDSLATIVYTSGTTGRPRGVMLTHGNLLSNMHAVNEAFPPRPGMALLAWLPFSHVAARTIDHFMSLLSGATVWLAESPEKAVANLAEAAPTHLSGVPRFYEKVLAAVSACGEAGRKVRLRALFGPRLDWVGCGSAPLPQAVARGFEQAGLPVLEAYGLTETAGVLTANRPDDYRLGTVGRPLWGWQVRIAADGEILARGPGVTAGYWNDPAATQEVIRDGWLHTGDLGSFDGDGYLSITGRKKELLILSNGKKVAPAEVEGLIVADPCIEQALVYGEGRNFLTALVVPSGEIRGRLSVALADDAEQVQGVLDLLSRRIGGALSRLPVEMQVKRFLVLEDELRLAGGDLTVLLKPRRSAIFRKYQTALERLYGIPQDRGEYPLGILERGCER
jgi:long-chain acyl-CoA synthetase